MQKFFIIVNVIYIYIYNMGCFICIEKDYCHTENCMNKSYREAE